MFFLLSLILLTILFVYLKLRYFTLYGPIPGKSPQFLFGNLLQIGLTHDKYIGHILKKFQDEYGDTFQIFFGLFHLIFVCNPEDLEHVFTHRHIYEQGDFRVNMHRLIFNDALICNIGHKYRRHASIVLPLFRRGKILNNYNLIVDCTDKLLDQWRTIADNDPNHIHLHTVDQSQNLSLEIFGLIGFNYDLETIEESNLTKSNPLKQALDDYLEIFLHISRAPVFLARIYLNLNPRYRRARRIIDQCLTQIIEQEQNKTPEQIAEQNRTSLVASLITSLQQDEKAEAAKPEHEKKGLSRSEVIDELLMFLVAGSETSGAALAWFVSLISKHPRVQAKLKAELGDDKHSRLPIEQIESFTYLDCVVKEVLRFCPPFPGATRSLTVDDRLPATGVQLRKGDEIFIPFYNLTRDRRYWKIDPELFYPERFQGEDKNHHDYAFIPFSGGHRECIGQDFAWFELKIIIVRLMQHVTFGDGGEQVNSGGHFQRLTTVPRNVGVTITFS